MPALSGRSAGRYSKQRRRKKDRSTTSNSTQPTVPGQQHATTPGNEASSTRSGRRPPAAGVGTAASGGSVIVTHSTGLKIETNATLVESTAVLTRQPAPRKHTVSVSTLAAALRQQPISTLYPDLTEEYVGVLARWKDRFSQAVWTRMTKHGTDRTPRCIKEMNECAPVVIAMRDALNRRASAESAPPPATIIDLCSGFGFLGMLLSEVLAPGTVERIHLVDQMWPMSNAKESGPTQITWEHIRTPGWPIPLRTRKTNLKKGAEMRQLEKYVVNSASGSVIVVGIHLCGTLAIKAVELFNRRKDKIAMMCLKPCCLPGRIHAAREESWSVRSLRASHSCQHLCHNTKKNLLRPMVCCVYCCASSGRQQSTQSICTAMTCTNHMVGTSTRRKEKLRATLSLATPRRKWLLRLRDQ